MINPNELRIGNITDKGIIFSFKFTNAWYIEFEGGKIKELEWVNPVIITDNILLKLGFEKYEFDHKPNQYRYKTRLIVIRNSNFYDYGTDVKLEFVHRLQNLYFETLNEELPTDKILINES